MDIIRKLSLCLLSCLLIQSCEGNDVDYDSLFSRTESLKIQYQSSDLKLADYNFTEETFIGFDGSKALVLELDKTGRILHKEEYGRSNSTIRGNRIITLGYLSQGIRIIETNEGYFSFNQNWDLVNHQFFYSKIRHDQYPIPLQLKTIHTKNDLILESLVGLTPNYKYERTFFDTARVLRSIDLNQNTTSSFMNFPENSPFKTYDELFLNFKPIITVTEENLGYMAFSLDPRIYKVDWAEEEIISSKEIDLKLFTKPQGISYNGQNQNIHPGFGLSRKAMRSGYLNSSIVKILVLNDSICVFYRPGITSSFEKTTLEQALDYYTNTSNSGLRISILTNDLDIVAEMPCPFNLVQVESIIKTGPDRFMVSDRKLNTMENSSFTTYSLSQKF